MFCNQVEGMVAQHCECVRCHWVTQFYPSNFRWYKFHLNFKNVACLRIISTFRHFYVECKRRCSSKVVEKLLWERKVFIYYNTFMVHFNYIKNTLRAYLRWVKVEKWKRNHLKVKCIVQSLDIQRRIEVGTKVAKLGPKEELAAQKKFLCQLQKHI